MRMGDGKKIHHAEIKIGTFRLIRVGRRVS